MIWPKPTPGLVVRYSYMWRWQADKGEESGRKARPCVIILAVEQPSGKIIAYLAPITHTPPAEEWAAVALPPKVKRRVGLDDEPSWIVTTEFNAFEWPGLDLLALSPQRSAADFIYGELSAKVIDDVLSRFRENLRHGRARVVKRTE